MSADAFENLIDAIYEASVVPEQWRAILDELARLSECKGGVLLTSSGPSDVRYIASETFLPLMQVFTEGGWMARNTRADRLVRANCAGFVTDLDLLTLEETDQDPLYTEVIRRHGGGFAIGTMVPVPSGDFLVFNIERAYEDGPVPREMIERLDPLRPHLARAALISARLGLERATAMVDALHAICLPAAVLARNGRSLAVNKSFEKLDAQIVQRAHSQIALSNPSANALFLQGLASIGSGAFREQVWSIPIPAALDQPAAIVHLVPVRGTAHDVFTGAFVILVVTPLSVPQAPSADLLNGLFDLTAAEARVARGIAEGKTVEGIAMEAGLSAGTVRQQLKSVFSKTGVSRQAELVAVLAGAGRARPI